MVIQRRGFIENTFAIAGAALFGTVSTSPVQGAKAFRLAPDPRLALYHMPPEDASHERTFMQWPVSLRVYDRQSLTDVQANIASIANAIAEFEPVVMLVSGAPAISARRQLSRAVEIWDIPTEDLWCRDSGPTFVQDGAGNLAVSHLRFNGWGNKQAHRKDGQIATLVAKRLGLPLLETGLIGEQGGVEHDGAGTLLAHASCWVNPNRNKGSADQIGKALVRALGAKSIIWAPGVKGKDITDYHIDALARFVAPGKVLIQISDEIDDEDPWSIAAFETFRILQGARDVRGQRLDLIRLPEPVDIRSDNPEFVSSYVNYYVCNGAVIMAQFGDRSADARAKSLLASLYPGRKMIALNIDALGEAGGGIHCATQQQPKTVRAI